jgi:hypothetical protein
MAFHSLKHPSGFVPILISLAALAMVFGYVSIYGVTRHQDEGTAARIFQTLMVSQLPIVLFFAFKWLPREPRSALLVMALQAVAWLAPIVAIITLER